MCSLACSGYYIEDPLWFFKMPQALACIIKINYVKLWGYTKPMRICYTIVFLSRQLEIIIFFRKIVITFEQMNIFQQNFTDTRQNISSTNCKNFKQFALKLTKILPFREEVIFLALPVNSLHYIVRLVWQLEPCHWQSHTIRVYI